ncbi:MAG: signal recognition particle receptor subunit alpha, partial [Bacteroidota bacterium]|nr:signal recognition particle receptor subunit alpha [Bacteroidota bacterium]
MGIFKRFFSKDKLDKGLEPSKKSILHKIGKAVAGKSTVDASVLDQLEEALISADIGVDTTLKIIDLLEKRVARDKYMNAKELQSILREEITSLLELHVETQTDVKPKVTLVVGVNGVGKTTTIGKLANLYKSTGLQVLLGAADTFRAAAV